MGVRKELGTDRDLGPLLGLGTRALSLFDFGHARFGLRLKLARLALGRGGSRLCTLRFSGLRFVAGLPGHVEFVGCCRFMVADKFHSFLKHSISQAKSKPANQDWHPIGTRALSSHLAS